MIYEILDAQGNVENKIEADQSFVEAVYTGRWRLKETEQQQPVATVESRHISVGAFYDRFGTHKWSILADNSPYVRAVIQDASVRDYIDLGRDDLKQGLQIIVNAGYPIDIQKIIDAPVEDKEKPNG